MTRFVTRIAYTNSEPFFFHWPLHRYPLISGVPRQLSQEVAKEDDILGGPLPLVETWNMTDRFEPLCSWGIAARAHCLSVLLLSRQPISELDRLTVGVTEESSTSVALLEVLIKERYGHNVIVRRGLEHDDDAWLVIGDQALRIFVGPRLGRWNYITDLATEWWNWQGRPFVFARWVVRRGISIDEKMELGETVKTALQKGMDSFSSIAIYQAAVMKIPSQAIEDYLRGFVYEFGPVEEESIRIFQSLVQKVQFADRLQSVAR